MANRKKDFSQIGRNAALDSQIEQAAEERTPGQQGTATIEEQKERIDAGRTMGRKGCKMPRINMAFTGSNYDFLKTMSRLKGVPLSTYVNNIITQYREEHPGLYEKALELIAEAEATED